MHAKARGCGNPFIADSPHSRIRTVFAGFGMTSEIKALISSGFTTHVIKPVEPDYLVKVIRDITEPKKLTRAS